NVPVDVSCNNVAVLGAGAASECSGDDSDSAVTGEVSPGDESDQASSEGLIGDILTDVVVSAPVNVPVDVSCNGVGVLTHGGEIECTGDDTDSAVAGPVTTGGNAGHDSLI